MRKLIERIAFYIRYEMTEEVKARIEMGVLCGTLLIAFGVLGYGLLFRRICNPPVLYIRICNPIDCSLFADGKAQRFERITNPYSIVRRIANHAETQKPPKHRSKRNTRL